MARPLRRLLLLPAAALLGGCAVVPRLVPLDASGMDYPRHVARDTLKDQWDRTSARITGAPRDLARHVEGSWRDLTVQPR